MYCLQLNRRSFIPYEGLREHYESPSRPHIRLVGILHQTIDALAEWNEHLNSGAGETSSYHYLRKLYSLDDQLVQWTSKLSVGWGFEVSPSLLINQPNYLKHLTKLPGAPTICHVYDNLRIIYSWNTYRILRICIHSSILKSTGLRFGETSLLPSEEQSLLLIPELFDEVCATVCSHFIVSVPGRDAAVDTQDIIGLRQFLLTLPLNVAMTWTRTLPVNPVPKAKWEWAEEVLAFLFRLNHVGR